MGVLQSQQNKNQETSLFDFTEEVSTVEPRLAAQEVQVQIAWANALVKGGILSQDEAEQATSLLKEALQHMQAGTFNWRLEDEDIHMNLERYVTDHAGELGKKMHLGRSRNDLIATTLRLLVKDCIHDVQNLLSHFIRVLTNKAEETLDILTPGFTHLQNGQPMRFAHILLAHAWAFQRDITKLEQAKTMTMAYMPSGAAALSGTHLDIDLASVAQELGFESAPANSYDSVSDRDFILDALDGFANVAVHLGRLSEDVIFWASTPVGLIKLPQAWSTGSSIMPNKRNPDIAELVRAKTSHILSSAINAKILMKPVQTSYGRDFQELKPVLFNSFDETVACLTILPNLVAEMDVRADKTDHLLNQGHLLATEIANFLTENGVPFREAYAHTAALVAEAENSDVQVHELAFEKAVSIAPQLTEDFLNGLSFEAAVEQRSNSGGTAKEQILAQIKALR